MSSPSFSVKQEYHIKTDVESPANNQVVLQNVNIEQKLNENVEASVYLSNTDQNRSSVHRDVESMKLPEM